MLGLQIHQRPSRRLHDLLPLMACLLVAATVAGCSFDTSEAHSCKGSSCSGRQTDAVSGSAKGSSWKPRSLPGLVSADDASTAQMSAAPRARPNAPNRDDVDETDGGAAAPSMNSGATADACSKPSSQKEICNTIDDDCDSKVDESCECPSSEPVACYDGPSGTLDVGACHAGTRSCTAGVLGVCLGAGLPSEETCNELDDDCNGQVDDLPRLAEDTQNCGHCGNACAGTDFCCDGRCVNPRGEDAQHCGGCGMACTQGQQPGCCSGRCVDLLSNATCGTCSNACGVLKLGGGLICSCTLTETEGPQCTALMNGDEWLCR